MQTAAIVAGPGASDVVLFGVGLFYAFAGLVGVRAALTERLLDGALSRITLQPVPPVERLRFAFLLAVSVAVFAGGALLLARLHLAAPAFIVSALVQAAYIAVLAPAYFDRHATPDPRGRQRTINAFLIYLAATLLVTWAAWDGRLSGLDDAAAWQIAIVGAAIVACLALAARGLARPPR